MQENFDELGIFIKLAFNFAHLAIDFTHLASDLAELAPNFAYLGFNFTELVFEISHLLEYYSLKFFICHSIHPRLQYSVIISSRAVTDKQSVFSLHFP